MKYIIGEKISRKKIIVKIIMVTVIFGWLCLIFHYISENNPYGKVSMSALIGLRIGLLIGYLFTVFAMITGISLRQYLVIDEQEICYYANDGFASQIRNTSSMLKNKLSKPLISIKINQIAQMTLLYSNVTSFFYFKGHMLIYRFDLKDGTYVIIKPDSFHFRDLNIAEGIEFMKDIGVKVNDPYHLLEGLKDPHMRFAEYVEKVVMKNEDDL